MSSSASGIDRMRLIHEALSLYHLHQRDDLEPDDGFGPSAEAESKPDAFSRA